MSGKGSVVASEGFMHILAHPTTTPDHYVLTSNRSFVVPAEVRDSVRVRAGTHPDWIVALAWIVDVGSPAKVLTPEDERAIAKRLMDEPDLVDSVLCLVRLPEEDRRTAIANLILVQQLGKI